MGRLGKWGHAIFGSQTVSHSRGCAQTHCYDETTLNFTTGWGISVSLHLTNASELQSKILDLHFDQVEQKITICIKETNQQHFDIWFHMTCFWRAWWGWMLPLTWLLFLFWVIAITPTFVSIGNLRKKIWINFNCCFSSWRAFIHGCFWSSMSK